MDFCHVEKTNLCFREYLNLSNNNIKNIEADAFIKCESLQTIDLSSNGIKSLSTFAPIIKTILLNKNSLDEWPQFPETVQVLDISENEILTVYNENDINFKNIEVRIFVRRQYIIVNVSCIIYI